MTGMLRSIGNTRERARKTIRSDFNDKRKHFKDKFDGKLYKEKTWRKKDLYINGSALEIFKDKNNEAMLSTLYKSIVRYSDPSVATADIDSEADIFCRRARGEGADKQLYIFNIVAALICAEVEIDEKAWSAVANSIRLRDLTHREELTDAQLPLGSFRARVFIRDEERSGVFLHRQRELDPVFLESGSVKDYEGPSTDLPLPYEFEEPVGAGAFGTVWKTRIYRKHVVVKGTLSDNVPPSNPYVSTYARKDLTRTASRHNGAEKDWEAHCLIQQSLNKERFKRISENFIYAEACLRFKDIVSVFMELAQCNLKQFMEDGSRAPAYDPVEDLTKITEIAGALDFLHRHIQEGAVQCYHLDLKPENILVKYAPEPSVCQSCYRGGYTLKLADFSVSRFVDSNNGQRLSYNLNNPYEPNPGHVAYLDYGSVACRAGGHATCVPPECTGDEADDERIDGRTDVWAFGCVLSIFAAWMSTQATEDPLFGVDAFRKYRVEGHPKQDGKRDGRDGFFVDAGNSSDPSSGLKLNPGVTIWFKSLIERLSTKTHPRLTLYTALWELLRNHMLSIDKEPRWLMHKVQRRLQEIASQPYIHTSRSSTAIIAPQEQNVEVPDETFANLIRGFAESNMRRNPSMAPGSSHAPNNTRDRSVSDAFTEKSTESRAARHFWKRKSSVQEKHQEPPLPWKHFGLKDFEIGIQGCMTSPSQDYVAFLYPKYVQVFSIPHLVRACEQGKKPQGEIVKYQRQTFVTCALTDEFLWLVPKAPCFTLLLYRLGSLNERLPSIIQWTTPPAYVVKRITPHPAERRTVACLVETLTTTGSPVLQVHVLRLDPKERIDQLTGIALKAPVDHNTTPADRRDEDRSIWTGSTKWEILRWNRPFRTNISPERLSFFFSMEGKHLVLAEENSGGGKIRAEASHVTNSEAVNPSIGEIAAIRWWTLETDGQPRGAALPDQGKFSTPCTHPFSIVPISAHIALAVSKEIFISAIDLSGDGRFRTIPAGGGLGPIFVSADGSSTFVVHTRNNQSAGIKRLRIGEHGLAEVTEVDRVQSSDLDFEKLKTGFSCQLIRGSESSLEKPPQIILIDRCGKGASLELPVRATA